MTSRRDEKERLRRERLAAEEAESRAAARRRWLQIGTAGAAVAVIAVIVIVIVASGGGGSSSSSASYSKNSVPPGAEVGVTDKPPPWPPNYSHLAERLTAMGLPQLNENIFHIHALLHVYINGKPVTIPPNVGLDVATNTFSPLHTHDTSGIIHIAADRTYSFTPGQFFAVWGV